MIPRKGEFWISFSICTMLIATGLVINYSQPKPPKEDLKAPTVSRQAPSSIKPSVKEIQQYTVAPDLPRYISIPAIHIDQARVIQLGLDKNNQIASPANIFDAGWYNASAKPGTPGAMFIYGHVSSWTANGLFHDLKKLKPGNTITIERGDGQKFTFAVKATKTYDANNVDMGAALTPVEPNTQGLNLMTCTGQVIKGTSEFNERLVVFASLQQ